MGVFGLWIASVLAGVAGAWYNGLNPTQPYLYEAAVLGLLSMLGGIAMLLWTALGQRLLLVLTVGVLPMLMTQAEISLHSYVVPTNEFVHYEGQVPVSLSTWTKYGRMYGRITNRHTKDWLRLANVYCTPGFANGALSDSTQIYSVGAGGWLAPGEYVDQPLLNSNGISWLPGYDLNQSVCRVHSADFYRAPAVVPTFTTHKRPDSKYVFEVTNNQQHSFTRISFSCWVDFAGSRSKQDLLMLPINGTGDSYIVNPGESVVFYNTESFAGRTLSDCAVRDVAWSK